MSDDKEISAIKTISRALDSLSRAAKMRVMSYFADRLDSDAETSCAPGNNVFTPPISEAMERCDSDG